MVLDSCWSKHFYYEITGRLDYEAKGNMRGRSYSGIEAKYHALYEETARGETER